MDGGVWCGRRTSHALASCAAIVTTLTFSSAKVHAASTLPSSCSQRTATVSERVCAQCAMRCSAVCGPACTVGACGELGPSLHRSPTLGRESRQGGSVALGHPALSSSSSSPLSPMSALWCAPLSAAGGVRARFGGVTVAVAPARLAVAMAAATAAASSLESSARMSIVPESPSSRSPASAGGVGPASSHAIAHAGTSATASSRAPTARPAGEDGASASEAAMAAASARSEPSNGKRCAGGGAAPSARAWCSPASSIEDRPAYSSGTSASIAPAPPRVDCTKLRAVARTSSSRRAATPPARKERTCPHASTAWRGEVRNVRCRPATSTSRCAAGSGRDGVAPSAPLLAPLPALRAHAR